MKDIKKRLAILLALSMILSCTMPAYADMELPVVEESVSQNTESQLPEEVSEAVKEISEEINNDEPVTEQTSPSETNSPEIETEPEKVDTESASPSDAQDNENLVLEETVNGIRITLTADKGVFPEGAELSVEMVEDEKTEEAIEEAVEKERDKKSKVASNYKFDIKVLVNGEEVQPDTSIGNVKVTFTLEEKISDCLDVNAYHLEENAAGELKADNLGAEVKTVETQAETESDQTTE